MDWGALGSAWHLLPRSIALDEDEEESSAECGEHLIVTECWVEPQNGQVINVSGGESHFLHGLDYEQVSLSVSYQFDFIILLLPDMFVLALVRAYIWTVETTCNADKLFSYLIGHHVNLEIRRSFSIALPFVLSLLATINIIVPLLDGSPN